jgi:hypothetical protein
VYGSNPWSHIHGEQAVVSACTDAMLQHVSTHTRLQRHLAWHVC